MDDLDDKVTHSLERTSPMGGKFVGTCRLCGRTGLDSGAALIKCPGGTSTATIDEMASMENLERRLSEWASENDQAIDEDADIQACHPLRTGDHSLENEAIRLVSAKKSKYGLVWLVHWLLWRRREAENERDELKRLCVKVVEKYDAWISESETGEGVVVGQELGDAIVLVRQHDRLRRTERR